MGASAARSRARGSAARSLQYIWHLRAPTARGARLRAVLRLPPHPSLPAPGPAGLGRPEPQVIMGGRPGLLGCCLCWWDHRNSLLSKGAQPDLHAPCCRFLPAISPQFYSFSEWTGRVNTFCVGGAKVPNKHMCPRSSSLIAPALSAAPTSNTYTCPVSCDSTRHRGCRFVCLCRPSVALQAICALSAHSQRLPTAGTQPERDLQHCCSFRGEEQL